MLSGSQNFPRVKGLFQTACDGREIRLDELEKTLRASYTAQEERSNGQWREHINSALSTMREQHTREICALQHQDDVLRRECSAKVVEATAHTKDLLEGERAQKTTLLEQLGLMQRMTQTDRGDLATCRKRIEELEASASTEKTLSAQEMGRVAEAEVAQCIAEVVPCFVQDVSNRSQQTPSTHGDRHLICSSTSCYPGLHIFLEVKKKQGVRPADVKRFELQVRQDGLDRANAALFVSLATETIPYSCASTTIEFVRVDGKPTIPVIYTASNAKKTIQACAICLAHLQAMCRAEYDARQSQWHRHSTEDCLRVFEEDTEALKRALPGIIGFVERQDSAAQQKINSLQAVIDEIRADRTELDETAGFYRSARAQRVMDSRYAGAGRMHCSV